MGHASINGITIAYDDVGQGDRTLVLVHGHPFDRSMWRAQAAQFGDERWRVIVPDLRGYGTSSVVAGKTTLDVFATDIAALLDHLGIRSVVVGGLSMGGQIAMEFCRLYRERVAGLLLAATFPRAETPSGKVARNAAADRLLAGGMSQYADEVLPKMLAPRSMQALPNVAAHVLTMMRATNPQGAAAALRGRAERSGYGETLAGLSVPSLIVVGDEDAFTTQDDATQMHQLLRGSELVWMKGVGHMPNVECPEQFNAALRRLLDRVADRLLNSKTASHPDQGALDPDVTQRARAAGSHGFASTS